MGRKKRTANIRPVKAAEKKFEKQIEKYEKYQYQPLEDMPSLDLSKYDMDLSKYGPLDASKYDLDLSKYKQENLLEDMPGMDAYTEAADYASTRFQQSQANIMQGIQGAAGASGAASVAQAMSGQATKFAREQQVGLGQKAAEARRLGLQESMRLQGQERQLMLQQDVGRRDLMLSEDMKQREMLFAQDAARRDLMLGEDRTRRDFDYGKMTTMMGVRGEQLSGARQLYASQGQADAQRSSGIMQAVGTIGAAKIQFGCIPEGIYVDTINGSMAIENIKPGDMVIGYDGNSVKVLQKHAYKEDLKTTFYDIKIDYNGKIRTVDVSGLHKIMNIPASDIKENVIEKNEYNGVEFSYDLLTEDAGYRMDGVPVNSMIEEMAEEIVKLKNK